MSTSLPAAHTSEPSATAREAASAADKGRPRLTGDQVLWALASDRITLAATVFILLVAFCAIFAPAVAPHDPNQQTIPMRNKPPGTPSALADKPPYVLGTDALGRDTLSRLIFGSRISLTVGLATVLISGTVGVTLGLLAGFYRGWVEDVIMRVVDWQMSLPSLLIALFVLFTLGPSFANVILVLVMTRWMVYARVTRGMMLTLREHAFVEAARALGCGDARIIVRHMLPNLLSPVLVLATLEVAAMMLTQASLDFLGMGIQPPDSSWGLMLAQGREYLTSAWWQVTFPGLAIMLTALSFNVLATWVRTVTDPVQSWRLVRR
ncbi:MAG: ABC transporter permease, partial [Chloroflexi bacterium]|nr:ABC transporter permease [Chloroflexota bacterium]